MKLAWSWKRLLSSGAFWLPAVLLGVLAWRHRWVADDGFIDLHIDDNLLQGFGPLFNRGERVEAYTSPLWIALLAVGGLVTKPFLAEGQLPPFEWISVAFGIACSMAALVVASLAAARLRGLAAGEKWPALPLGSLVVLAMIPFWDYSTSGLETSLVFLWLAVAFWSCVRLRDERRQRDELAAGFWISLGPLVRPDLGIFCLLFGALVLAVGQGWRRRLEILAALVALPAAYQLFRMGYFACLVPNTALAKEAGLAYWSHGWVYFKEVETTYHLWIPLLAITVAEGVLLGRFWQAHDRYRALLVGSTFLGGVLYGLYITRVGADFLHARMLLPALFALVLPIATVGWRELRWFGPVIIPWAVLCFWSAEIPLDKDGPGIERGRLNFVLLSKNDYPVSLDDYREMGWSKEVDSLFSKIDEARAKTPALASTPFYSASAKGTIRWVQLAPWVQAETVAYRGAVGIFAYKARGRVYVCDYYGLADPLGSRLELSSVDKDGVWHSGRGKPGHEKRLKSDWCVARTLESIEDRPPGANVRIALDALGCGELAELQAAVTEPLSWGRFWKNVWLSARLTRLRIPQDILAARERFCVTPPN